MADPGGNRAFQPSEDYECPVCGEAVETMSDIYDHLRVHDVEISELRVDADGGD